MQRISKGVSWRDVQPEWCMMVLLAPTCTALALTVRHASCLRQERYASCVKLSPDFTVAGRLGRPGPGCQRAGPRTGLTICSRKVRAEETRWKGRGQEGDGRELTGGRGGGQNGRGGAAAAPKGSPEGGGEGTASEGAAEGEGTGRADGKILMGAEQGPAGMVGAGFRAGGRGVQLRRAEGQKCGDEERDARWGERNSA